MSGTGVRGYLSASPKHAKEIADSFLGYLKITETDPEKIHQILIKTPIEDLINATSQVQAEGPITFSPVVELKNSGQTVILDKDPQQLFNEGQGKNIPVLIGFTNLEGEFFKPLYYKINILAAIKNNPLLVLSPDIIYKVPEERALEISEEIQDRYFNGTPTVEKFANIIRDIGIIYPALYLAGKRSTKDSASVYLYEFSYNPDFSAIKVTKDIQYVGAAHVEDLTFIFQTNSLKNVKGFVPRDRRDTLMRRQMTSFVKNFMTCNAPVCGCGDTNNIKWPPESEYCPIQYENIVGPSNIQNKYLSDELKGILTYFDKFFNEAHSLQ